MTVQKIKIFSTVAVIGCLFTIVGFKSRVVPRKAQTASSSTANRNQSASSIALPVSTKTVSSAEPASHAASPFEDAARTNSQLQAGLSWNFGGRTQYGWSIYSPLIANLISANSDAGSSEFAKKLSIWQSTHGIEPSGILDRETWSRMISTFQAARLSGRPAPGPLVTIPITDCYDASRVEELRKVTPETYAAYKRMIAAAAADPSLQRSDAYNDVFFKIVSAYRSQAYQDQLRRQSPNVGRAGLAASSPHSTGRALDLYVGGEPVSTKDPNRAIQTQTPAYRWLVKNAGRFGFRPYFYEPWHWEFVGTTTELNSQSPNTK